MVNLLPCCPAHHTRVAVEMESLLSSAFRQDLKATRERVGALYEFFCRHAEFCNAHTVGFFTEDHWNNVIEPSWRDQLLAVDEENEHEWATKLKIPPGMRKDENRNVSLLQNICYKI